MKVVLVSEENHGLIAVAADRAAAIDFLINTEWIMGCCELWFPEQGNGINIEDLHLDWQDWLRNTATDEDFENMGFGMFGIMFFIVFALVIGMFIVVIVRGISEWNKNNHSPRLIVDATVVTKRTNVSHHHHANAGNSGFHSSTSTTYYVTFQVESGDRMEMHVSGNEFGMLVEGDRGKLSFQGTRYLGFERY